MFEIEKRESKKWKEISLHSELPREASFYIESFKHSSGNIDYQLAMATTQKVVSSCGLTSEQIQQIITSLQEILEDENND